MSERRAVVLHETQGTWIGWMASPIRYTALGADTNDAYALSIGRVSPGVGPRAHRHDFEEGFFVIEGELSFTAGNHTFTVPAGGFVNIVAGTVHAFQNATTAAAEVLVLAAPAGFDRFQLEVGERLAGPESPVAPPAADLPARMAAAAIRHGIDLDPPAAALEQPPALHATLPGAGPCVAVVGDVYRFLATGRETAGKYALWEAIVPPGGGPPPHVHSREQEGFFILEGEVAFEVDGQRVVGKPGTAVALPPGVWHAFRNVSEQVARMLVYVAPAGLEEMFLEVGQPLPPGATTAPAPTHEEIERLLATAPKYGIEIGPPA